jgi:hypothetical protein
MEYRSNQYSVVQSLEAGLWKWTVNDLGGHTKSGTAPGRAAGVQAATSDLENRLLLLGWSGIQAQRRTWCMSVAMHRPFLYRPAATRRTAAGPPSSGRRRCRTAPCLKLDVRTALQHLPTHLSGGHRKAPGRSWAKRVGWPASWPHSRQRCEQGTGR